MNRDRLIQLIAVVVMVVATTASGTLLPRIIRISDDHALRYTDVSVDGAPAFVALGTTIGALRGLIVDILWIKVNIRKEQGLFYEVMADSELITKLQPRFAAVWAFHGHNMAYNISVATHTEAERWEWVKAGIRLVRNEGLKHNPNDIVLHKELAFWHAHKIEGVADDAHLYYKQQFCNEWHRLLGRPPETWDERVLWMKEIADAPDSIEQAKLDPEVSDLVSALETMTAPFAGDSTFELGRSFLDLYSEWSEVAGRSEAAEATGARAAIRDRNQYFVAFDDLASDESRAGAWKTLIATVRKQLLRDEYNMSAQLMYEYTRDVGPIDWRHGQAHALYWSRRGAERAERRVLNDDDIYKVLNNDRLQLQAMQALARFGRIYFDPISRQPAARFPDPRWVEAVYKPRTNMDGEEFPSEFERLYLKHYDTRGGGAESFIGFLQNFMGSSIREWYRAGEFEMAGEMMDFMDGLFGRGQSEAIGKNPMWSMPLDVFVRDQTREQYGFQPHIAPSEVGAALRYAYVVGLGQGQPEKLEQALVTNLFKSDENIDYTNKFGVQRMAEILSDLEESRFIAFWRVMIDRSVRLPTRLVIWSQADEHDPRLRVFAYDMVRPFIEQELQTSHYGQMYESVDEVLPEPPNMAQYRAQMAQQTAESLQLDAAARARDTIARQSIGGRSSGG
ncbi:MAG: hypothetical protein ACYTGR_10660 [Planctomycetota bacterium]|jgi:hypothetical protein